MLRHSSNIYADGFKISTPLRCDFIQIAPVTVSLSWRGTLCGPAVVKAAVFGGGLAAQNG